ncbi:MAG: rhomboid family intramembrane serine protease [Rhodobiaceae bacterium]|nr:rhomboid family intramembrane serine protease [Rhodobiaceae bacterium]MCC0048882.1 rhomboid family intramembrane serine protease [Rhodobiaceae bacterium]
MIEEERNPPAFNVPAVLMVLLAVMAIIQGVRQFVPEDMDVWIIYAFGFVPGRYAGHALQVPMPLGAFGDVLGFFTYSLLHGSWMHLASNALWLVAFGAAVARRFAALRFVIFGVVCAVAGALAHLATHWGELVPMVGASAAVSGYMAAAIRFAFSPGGPLSPMGRLDPERAAHVPAVGILAAFRNRSVIAFTAIWMAFNLLFGLGVTSLAGVDGEIAWQAHVGGFFAGLLLFGVFDPVRPAISEYENEQEI